MKMLDAAFVIGRRDFIATVMKKTFLLFLLAPALFGGIMVLFGYLGGEAASDEAAPVVAVISSEEDFRRIDVARSALRSHFGDGELAELEHYFPADDVVAQRNELLADTEDSVVAVLTGGLAEPTLTGTISESGRIRRQLTLVLDEVKQRAALEAGGRTVTPTTIALESVEQSGESIADERELTALIGQMVIFMVTLFLATMLLSNLVEEKSNKIIEILAAAVPIDAIFLGKMFAMLAMSIVGILVWGAALAIALTFFVALGFTPPEPAVGWPLFLILLIVYYCANYLLLGALFLGTGAQASSVREVQTLSMPVTMVQMVVFAIASFSLGRYDEPVGLAAAAFPLSSPLVMIARAAQSTDLLPHLIAIAWQALWVWIIVRIAARLFRRNVMKSGRAGKIDPPPPDPAPVDPKVVRPEERPASP